MTGLWRAEALWRPGDPWGGAEGGPTTPVPVPIPNPWGRMRHIWTGWDGSEWDLSNPWSSPFLTGGVRGWSMPEAIPYKSTSPAIHGARHRGYRVIEREVHWPLYMFSNMSSDDWLARDSAFMRTMSFERQGTWTIVQPDGRFRSLPLRFVTDNGASMDRDPAFFGFQAYGINLEAEAPFWRGGEISRLVWYAVESEDFHSEDGDPYVVSISPGTAADMAIIDNPGDEPAWPVWTLNGPFDSAEVGVGDAVIEVPFSLDEGESLTLNSDPRLLTAIDQDGVERTGEIPDADWASVPPGEEVPVTVNVVGGDVGADVRVSLVPLHNRAW